MCECRATCPVNALTLRSRGPRGKIYCRRPRWLSKCLSFPVACERLKTGPSASGRNAAADLCQQMAVSWRRAHGKESLRVSGVTALFAGRCRSSAVGSRSSPCYMRGKMALIFYVYRLVVTYNHIPHCCCCAAREAPYHSSPPSFFNAQPSALLRPRTRKQPSHTSHE